MIKTTYKQIQKPLNHIDIGYAFIQQYYTMLDNKDESIINLFNNNSKIVFDNEEYVGLNIMSKYNSIFECLTHHDISRIQTMNSGGRSICIQVYGQIIINGNNKQFTQYFQLLKGGNKKSIEDVFWIQHSMFMLLN